MTLGVHEGGPFLLAARPNPWKLPLIGNEGALDYGDRMTRAAAMPEVTIVPANEASCDDLHAVLGRRGDPSRCQCQWYKIRHSEWRSVPVEVDPKHPMTAAQLSCYYETAAGSHPIAGC
ncbi:MAG: hypothetical protein QOH10_450 [Actinomycetota bacterium]|nr:hypothetical protein [Actinomycetota bacterium]